MNWFKILKGQRQLEDTEGETGWKLAPGGLRMPEGSSSSGLDSAHGFKACLPVYFLFQRATLSLVHSKDHWFGKKLQARASLQSRDSQIKKWQKCILSGSSDKWQLPQSLAGSIWSCELGACRNHSQELGWVLVWFLSWCRPERQMEKSLLSGAVWWRQSLNPLILLLLF